MIDDAMTPHALPDASKQPVIAPSVQRAIDATENAPPVHLGVLNPTNDADQPYQPHQQTGGAAEPDGIHTSHLIGEECATGGEVRRNGTGWECTTLDTSTTAPGSISNSDGDWSYGFSAGANEAEETAEGGHRLFVTSGRGVTYDIPKGWSQRIADNDKGLIFQRPAAVGNADMIRIMEPTTRYPRGYVRVHNSHGQPVDVFGKPGSKPATHISQDYIGPWPAWPK